MRIDHSDNSKTVIQRCSLKYDHALKSLPNVKVQMGQGIQERTK